MATNSFCIIIPSDDFLVDKDYSAKGNGSPVEEDNSLWLTTIYDYWDITDICLDINKRLFHVGVTVLDIDSPEIAIIREGLSIVSDRIMEERYSIFFETYQQCLMSLKNIFEGKLKIIDYINSQKDN